MKELIKLREASGTGNDKIREIVLKFVSGAAVWNTLFSLIEQSVHVVFEVKFLLFATDASKVHFYLSPILLAFRLASSECCWTI